MFKVLIVDDEIYVVALIQKLIDWEKFGMCVEATANDGITALRLVKEIKPDLVIVDVRMPGYDGISFMDKVREFNENVRFIVISGHKQFDYARGAMRNNVEDYLLKPINKEELESVIGQVYEKLVQSQEKESHIKEMKEELDTSKKRIRESLLKEFQREGSSEFSESLEKINQRYLTNLQEGSFLMCALILDAPVNSDVSADRDLLLYELSDRLRNSMQTICMEVVDLEQEKLIFYLLNFEKGCEVQVEQMLHEFVVKCQGQVQKFEQVSLTVCTGGICSDFAQLEEGIQKLWRCMASRAALGGFRVIKPEDIRDRGRFLPVVTEARGEKLMKALTELNVERLSYCIREMFSKAFYGIEEESLLYFRLYRELSTEIYKYFTNIGMIQETEKEYEQRMLKSFIQTAGAREYGRLLCDEVQRLINENQLSETGQATPAIRIVKRYIAEHYMEEISLSSAAQVVNLSAVYLSRLFKKEEGINFLDYVNQYRIGVAKKLLCDVQYNVLEAADLSGFKNTRYFSKIFKKAVGITPSEYRKRHLGKEEG